MSHINFIIYVYVGESFTHNLKNIGFLSYNQFIEVYVMGVQINFLVKKKKKKNYYNNNKNIIISINK
ncbi:hypothetical protein PFTANZ_02281 [Plasmodium falciparum Tanzania (2000708)]|uniref:Uncharacterized protein n=2 Tax=Plasmodium falciparum TaxID=5833 RepID=A0A024W8G1_PLAFA|nr:hypothetical protein PFFVO_02214 [Plasmodium falciparum Vietnam Oak-Knoll (FVO)]ETW36982.1 hypothetical protein PFTANZ_02281 [Plasmodium falciparum Tanzania (2000708)]